MIMIVCPGIVYEGLCFAMGSERVWVRVQCVQISGARAATHARTQTPKDINHLVFYAIRTELISFSPILWS